MEPRLSTPSASPQPPPEKRKESVLPKKGSTPNFKKPWWQRRLERSIEQWRKDLGRVLEIRKGVQLKEKVLKELERRYQLSERGRTTVVTFLKNEIQAVSMIT